MDEFEQIQLLSFNTRGIGDSSKRREVFRWLKRYHRGGNSIIMLQETHSTLKCEEIWQREWGSKIYFSHGSNTARGVAILMPMKFNFDIRECWKDKDGRILALTITLDDKSLNVVNLYAPTKDKITAQLDFLKLIDLNLPLAEEEFIIGGDLNTYLNILLDKEGGRAENQSKFSEQLNSLLNEH